MLKTIEEPLEQVYFIIILDNVNIYIYLLIFLIKIIWFLNNFTIEFFRQYYSYFETAIYNIYLCHY